MPDSNDLCCSCGVSEDGATIRCTDCRRKYHLKCVEISELFAKNITAYHCKKCTNTGAHTIECEVRRSTAADAALHSRPPTEHRRTDDTTVPTKEHTAARGLNQMASLTPSYSRPKLHHKGYAFSPDHWRNQRCGTNRYWRCKYDKRCTARIRTSTEGGEVVRELGGHNHPPMERSATAKTASNLRDVAPNSNVAVAPVVPPKVKSSPTGSPSGLRHKGYAYSRERRSRDGMKQYWYCKARHAAAKCPARIHTLVASGEVLHEVHEHNHPPVDASEADEGASHCRHTSANSNVAVASSANHPKVSPARIGYQHNGYAYNREYRSETKQYWSCKWMHQAVKCMARLHTSIATGEVVYEAGDHNHPPMDGVQGKYTNCTKAHNTEKHQTAPSHPKKPFVRKSVNASNNSTPATTDASANSCNPAKVVERFMALDPAKRATVASLFRALLDEMENDGDDPQ